MKWSIKRIIILTELPFIDRHYTIWGVDTLIKNGFSVEVWDISSFLYDFKFGIQDLLSDKNVHFKHCKFSTKTEIINALSNVNRSDFLNVFIGYYPKIFFIYRIISKKKIAYAVPLFNTLPISQKILSPSRTTSLSLIKKFLAINKTTFIKNIPNMLIQRYSFGIKPASLAIAGGTASLDNTQYPVGKNTQILWAHSIDYDIFLQNNVNNEKNVTIPSNTGVFLDDYLPFHSDFEINHINPPVSPEEYYPKLCKFFSYLEKKFGISIIIAAHPCANYDQLPDYFEGRPVFRSMTAQLVKKSRFVMIHASTSINFAILYQKPIVFLTLDKLYNHEGTCSRMGEMVENMAFLLHKTSINLDKVSSINLDLELEIDKNAYKTYKNLHIKKDGSEERELWQLFADHIKENY